MARQVGILKLSGVMGDLSFYKSVYGFLARKKTGVSRKAIMTDPRFKRTRENASEFGHSAKSAKLIRVAIRPLLHLAKDSMTVQRLTKELVKVMQSDSLNIRGMRKVSEGNLGILKGFDFNNNGRLSSTFLGSFTLELDGISGTSLLKIAPFSPLKTLRAPEGTTHFKIAMGIAKLDFNHLKFQFSMDDTGMLLYTRIEVPEFILDASLSSTSGFCSIQVMGISFFQWVNGEYYPLKNGENNVLTVIGV